MRSSPYHSRGIALLTTLLVVSVVTILATSMIKRQLIDIRKTQNRQRMEQSWAYAHGIEIWALGRLQQDLAENKTDSEQDGWNLPIETTEVEGGQLSANIVDLQGRFNLNNLARSGKDSDAGEAHEERFRRLLTVLDLDPGLINPLLDWIDDDSDIHYPDGAEESHYSLLMPPYRPANRAIADISELRLIKGFTPAIYQRLAPHVAALPGNINININTATLPVVRSLGEKVTEQDAQAIIDARTELPFDAVQTFLQHQLLAGLDVKAEGLGVTSNYFAADSHIAVGQLRLGYRTIIYRKEKDKARVIQRAKRGILDE